jgi:hypothetical protein
MSRTSILAIFASAGLVFSGTITPDSIAFARALQADDPAMLARFAQQNPDSSYREDAIRLAQADDCRADWREGGCRTHNEIVQTVPVVTPPPPPERYSE